MSSIEDDYESSWEMVQRAWETLRNQDADNEWLKYYDGKTLQTQTVANLLWTKEDYIKTTHGLLHLLSKYQTKLETELQKKPVPA